MILVNEKYYTLKISKYMYDTKKKLGVQVTLTRDKDGVLTLTNK